MNRRTDVKDTLVNRLLRHRAKNYTPKYEPIIAFVQLACTVWMALDMYSLEGPRHAVWMILDMHSLDDPSFALLTGTVCLALILFDYNCAKMD